MEGFNCPAERLCVPFRYLCDGVPDCVTIIIAVEESLPQCYGQYNNSYYHNYYNNSVIMITTKRSHKHVTSLSVNNIDLLNL